MVPQDISVIGFDNARVTFRHKPGITTVEINMEEVGRQSVERLLQRLKQPELPVIDILVGCKLVEKGSVCTYEEK